MLTGRREQLTNVFAGNGFALDQGECDRVERGPMSDQCLGGGGVVAVKEGADMALGLMKRLGAGERLLALGA